jgi:site-specific DNA-methyltransferase (adenine-specific)
MKLDLFNEDCMDVMARYPDNYFDLAIVDPPYGIGESGGTNASRSKLATSKTYKPFAGGDKSAPNSEYFNGLKRVSKHQIIWGANHMCNITSLQSSCWLVWDKENGATDFADCELAFCSHKTTVRIFRYRWQGMLQGGKHENRIHPTQKPVELYKWLYANYAKEGMKILDTHLGSGSNTIAAYEMNMGEFVGCELDADYFAAAQKRIDRALSQQKLF